MKPAHLTQAAHHANAINRNSHAQANTQADKTSPDANGFAQMLLNGMDESVDSGELPADNTTTLSAGDQLTDNSQESGTDTPVNVSLSHADPSVQPLTPAQAMMAMLVQAPTPAPTTGQVADNTPETATTSVSGNAAPMTGTLPAPAGPLEPNTLFNPAGHAMPEQAVAKGLQDKDGATPPTDVTQPPAAPSGKASKPDIALPEQTSSFAAPPRQDRTVGRHVSSAAKDTNLSGPPPTSLATVQGLESTVSWHMATPGQPGSALNANAVTPLANEVAASNIASQQSNTSASGDETNDPHEHHNPSLAAVDALGAPSDTTPSSTTAPDSSFAMSLGEALGDAFESLGAQVSFWAAQNTKRASMNLDAGLDSPLSVDVSLDQGQVQLAFRTDDAAAQAAIKSHAQAALSDLLARSGIGLAGLSVGAQTAQGQGGQPQHQGQNSWQGLNRALDRVATAQDTAATTSVTTLRNRSGLDVYA